MDQKDGGPGRQRLQRGRRERRCRLSAVGGGKTGLNTGLLQRCHEISGSGVIRNMQHRTGNFRARVKDHPGEVFGVSIPFNDP